jgi:DNA-binding transcriptional MocR family regulator
MSYEKYKKMNLHIDLSRGKPCKEQLNISMPLLNYNDFLSIDGTDCRNYGLLDGIVEAKSIFAEIFDCENEEVFIGGNSSLNLLYSILEMGVIKDRFNNKKKILCPCPGYDRHFKIAEYLGFELIPIKLNEE